MREKYLKQFLNFFWLRPENALLLTLRAESYNSTLKYFGDGKNTLDISCGDGVFSFITCGGEISCRADMFRSVNTDKTFREGNFDSFDHFDESYFVEVTKKPDFFYEYGTDWKINLLNKAKQLNFYKKLICHDNNIPLPFPDGIMTYVYSNSTYWVENFEAHLLDIVRITKTGGHIVLEMKVDSIKKYTYAKYLPFMGDKFHQIIDAGRLSTWKGLRSIDEVITILKGFNNIEIKLVKPIYGDILAIMWDIGLRPLFNPLVKWQIVFLKKNGWKLKESGLRFCILYS